MFQIIKPVNTTHPTLEKVKNKKKLSRHRGNGATRVEGQDLRALAGVETHL